MSDSEPLPHDPTEACAILIARARDGGPEEQRALEDWVGRSQQRAAILARLQQGWDAVEGLRESERMQQWRAAAQELRRSAARTRRAPSGVMPWLGRLAAGVVVAAVLIAATTLWLSSSPSRVVTLEAPFDAIAVRRLADGSTVTLDRGAKIAVQFDSSTRIAELVHGQARFEVAHLSDAASRPFLVRMPDREIRATGTDFTVQQLSTGFVVSLLEGGVTVSSVETTSGIFAFGRTQKITPIARLHPGQQLVQWTGERPTIRAFNAAEVNAWENGRVILNGERLLRAAEIMSRYSRTEIVIVGEHLRQQRVSGAFAVGNVNAFANTIAELYPGAVITQQPGRLVITMASSTK